MNQRIKRAVKATAAFTLLAAICFAFTSPFVSTIGAAADKGASSSDGATGATSAADASPPAPLPVCDGVYDDTASLQAMLDAGSVSRAPVVIPATPNGCVVSRALKVRSNTHIIQNGLLTLKYYVHTNVTQWGVYNIVDGAENIRIEGKGTIDVNRKALHPHICCVGGIVSGGPEVGDYDANVKDISIRGLTIVNVPQWPVSIDGATNVKIESVTASHAGASFSVGHNSHNAVASNLRISDITDICFAFYRGVHNSSISNSTVSECSGAGISVFTDSPNGVPPGRPSSDINIVGNIAYETNGGIDVSGIGEEASTGVNITGNQVHHNRVLGIGLAPCNGCQVTGNLIHDNGVPGVNYEAGVMINHSRGALIANNTIYNEGQGSVTGLGFSIHDWHAGSPASERITVTGNYIYDDQATKTMVAAVGGRTTRPIVVTGNTFGAMIGPRDALIYAPGSIHVNYEPAP